MNNAEQKLDGLIDSAHNFNLEDTADERNGLGLKFCIRLADAKQVLAEAIKAARVNELENQIEFFMSLPDARFTDLFIKRILENKIKELE